MSNAETDIEDKGVFHILLRHVGLVGPVYKSPDGLRHSVQYQKCKRVLFGEVYKISNRKSRYEKCQMFRTSVQASKLSELLVNLCRKGKVSAPVVPSSSKVLNGS